MKYWISYLVAAIFAVITLTLTRYAEAHTVLIDMVYPYMSRIVMTTLAEWSAGGACVWQKIMTWAMVGGGILLVLICVFKWNLIQWIGWALSLVSLGVLLNTAIYELNAYASPLADDMRLEVASYTVADLSEATNYYRDKANTLATKVNRDPYGNPDFGTFEEMANQAGDGFRAMTYDQAVSVFAGSTVPVKVQTRGTKDGVSGKTIPLTGEALVNPDVPTAAMPFAMCKEMAHRMCIYSDVDANFAAYLAGSNNSSVEFQYSAYLMAYYYCYETLSRVDTNAARASAASAESGLSELVRRDLEACRAFYRQGTVDDQKVLAEIPPEERSELMPFTRYSGTTDLLASWYYQQYILPRHQEEETPFNPYDPGQVDLSGIVNAPEATEG